MWSDVGEHSTRIAALTPGRLVWLQQRLLEHELNARVVENVEDALARGGLRPERPQREPAIAFVDPSGYTKLTHEAGDELAVCSAAHLQELADAAARSAKGRLVKLLGDGVLLRFPATDEALPAVVHLVATIEDAGLPHGHAGIAAGRVIAATPTSSAEA